MTILIVGVNGVLGRAIASLLISAGNKVDGVFHKSTDYLPNGLRDGVDATQLETIANRTYDAVLIVAGFIPYGRMDTADPRLAEANIALVHRVCGLFPKARIVLASSISVYGTPSGTLDEFSPFDRPSLYGLSKLGGEAVVRQHASYAVLRFSSLYGPGMTGGTFLTHVIDAARGTRVIEVWGDGSRRQDYLHFRDAAAMMVAAAASDWNGVVLGVNGKSSSNLEVAQLVADCFEGCVLRRVGTDTSPSFVFDAAASHAQLGTAPEIALKDGIREMIGEPDNV